MSFEETHQFFQSTRLSEGARAGVVFLVFRFMGQKNQSAQLFEKMVADASLNFKL